MKEVKITADIQATWGDTPPRYRVFVDQTLMTERDFVYNGAEIYITESMLVRLKPGGHTITLEQVNGYGTGTVKIKNIAVNNSPIDTHEFVVTE
jgi:hypothetical protein